MENRHLYQPLLTTIKTTISPASSTAVSSIHETHSTNHSPSNSDIVLRLILIISVGFISIWANYEASKGFDISIINEVKGSPAGKTFQLLYVSNDKASRIVLNASSFVERVLYPENGYHSVKKKQVKHVSVNLTYNTTVSPSHGDCFDINISPLMLMGDAKKIDHAVKSAIFRGIARVWLSNGGPPGLKEGMVEHLGRLAGFGAESDNFCSSDKDCSVMAHLLDQCEKKRKRLIPRLNRGLGDGLVNQTADNAYEMFIQKLINDCEI